MAIACAIAMPALAQTQQQIPTPTIIGIKAGETLQLYTFSAVTRNCAVLYKGFDGVDVLDGDPDLSVEYWEKRVEFITASGKRCENVPGVVFLLTASKDITEEKESNLTIRLRYRTRSGSFPLTLRYYVLMYPASEEASMGPGVAVSVGVSIGGINIAAELDRLAAKYPWAVRT